MTRNITALMALALSLGACASEVDNKPAAEVAPAPPPAEKLEEPAGKATMLKANAESSSISFVGAKVTGDHTGTFGKIDGTGKLEGGELTATTWTVDLSSVETDAEKLTGHLKTADFFDVEQFPTATFESSSIAKTDDGHEVKGTLDLHGQKNEITFPATIAVIDNGASLKAEFTIKRFDWGIEYPGKADDLIKDEVLLKVDVALDGPAGAKGGPVGVGAPGKMPGKANTVIGSKAGGKAGGKAKGN